MNKEFIPYEQALELKELGFNEYFDGWYYRLDGKLSRSNYELEFEDARECIAPLYQQAFRWFREKYGYSGIPNPFGYELLDRDDINYEWACLYEEICNNYEEAELACLKKLIEIAKQIKYEPR